MRTGAKEVFLSVVIPAYNEAERLPATLIDIDRKLHDAGFSYEILVVNDGSGDATAEVIKKMSADIANLFLIDNQANKGKGGVVRQGMLEAHGKYRLFTDADNSTTVDQFAQMIPHFESGYDVVIGSRAAAGAKLDPPESLFRQLAGKGLNLLVQALLLPGLWDTQCGFKAFTAEAAGRIFQKAKIPGWAFDVEVLSLARAYGYRIKEVPVHWVNSAESRVKFSAGLQFLRDIVIIRWWLWRGGYALKRPEMSTL